MITPALIDTTSLLTILGIIVAVWSLISSTSRLRFRFCMAWWDWCIGGIVFFLVHYLVFAPVLEKLGLYYSFGQWKWGLDSSSAVYLLLLSVALYFFWRTRSPTLVRGKVHIFLELIEHLHLTKRYDELVLLVEPQLPKLISLTKQQPFLVRLIDRLDSPNIDKAILLSESKPKTRSAWSTFLQYLKSSRIAHSEAKTKAHEVLFNLITSPELIIHLALAHPYFCLKLLETNEAIQSDFIENFIDALLDTPESRLYVELKNNQNLNCGSRLLLPESNRLLRFFFTDAALAVKYGMDKAIGEAVCLRLDEDNKLAEKLNKSLGSYYELGKFRCPINSGITLFEIMVHEGIHQGLHDHMWLHYFKHFAEKILKQMIVAPEEDIYLEWRTPFHYLLYRLISIASSWTEQCSHINDSEIPPVRLTADSFDRHYISKEATKVLGTMLEYIIPSEKLSISFKTYLLTVVIRSYVKLEKDPKLADVTSSYLTTVIIGTGIPTKRSYRLELRDIFSRIDHVLRLEALKFKQALDDSCLDLNE